VRAAVRGVIDFHEARLLDPEWWRRCRALLRELVREDDIVIQRSILDFHRALVSNSGLDDDSFKTSQEHAKAAVFDMMGLVRPWEGGTYEDRKRQEYKQLIDSYIEEFGDPNDPEFQEKEAKALEAWQAQLAARPEETDIERVMRLRREQTARVQEHREQREQLNRQGR
jgi:hypothetical protein